MKQQFLNNIELWLTGVGLVLVAVLPPLLFGEESSALWKATAIIAILVGAVHGLIFWLIRARQRSTREKAIREVQAMLQDQINNQLQVILMKSKLDEAEQEGLATIANSVSTISRALERIDEQTLADWNLKSQSLPG